MANISITASDVAPVQVRKQHTGPASEAITAGQYVRLVPATGYVALGNGTTAGELGNVWGIALNSVAANEAVTFVSDGDIGVGSALSGLDFDDPVYVSDTDGTLADADDGTVDRIAAFVIRMYGSTTATADKILRLNTNA